MSDIYEDLEKDDTSLFLGNVDTTKPNALVPPPPKNGEYIYCQWCKGPLLPEQLSEDKKVRRLEIKWHYHNDCRMRAISQLDMQTPGLMSERRLLEKRAQMLNQKPKEVKRRKSFLEMSTSGNRR